MPAGKVVARLTGVVLYVAVILTSFAIYASNPQTLASFDSAPNSLLALNLLRNHRLDLDQFRGSYFTGLGGQYAFEEGANGHLASAYPVGTAILSLPIYVAIALAERGNPDLPALDSPAFEPFRQQDEKLAAAAIAAVSVGMFLLCARELANLTQAAIATAVYALATSIWSTASQALWQHGPVNVFVLAMAYALFRARRMPDQGRTTRWLLVAGLCAGFLTVIRPTAALFSIAGLMFVAWAFRRRAVSFVVALAVGAAPGVAWNAYFFHSLLGGYGGIVPMSTVYVVTPAHVVAALAGLLISPSRGILVFSPILIFALVGVVRVRRVRDRNAALLLLLTAACGVLLAQYAIFAYWWGGFAYGPRYLCDTAGVAALLLVYAIPPNPVASVRRSAAAATRATIFAVLFSYSVIVQFAGVNSGAAGSEWNAVPVSVNRDPGRVWPIADNQIERNVRAAYFRFFAWDVARAPRYVSGLATHVTAIAPALVTVTRGTSIDATVVLSNDGRSRIYGYDSGVYVGQMRVAVSIIDEHHRVASTQYLYLSGTPPTGARASALGTITMPSIPGRYRLECTPVLVGGDTIPQRGVPLGVAVLVDDAPPAR